MQQVTKLYHCTKPVNIDSIKEQGLKPLWGYVFLCDNPNDAFGFMQMRAFDMDGDIEIEVNGSMVKFPNMIKYDHLVVIGIDATKLDWSQMCESDDHNPMFYQGTVYAYEGVIPPDTFVSYTNFPVEWE